jgi:dTDP-4-amino-4,6-dideoxygalactose transaminase
MKNEAGVIPFVDLVTPHQELEEELVGVVRNVLKTGMFAGGPMVESFEKDFARFCGTEHCVAVSNGTDALRFALIAAGVEPGDCVITVSNTFVATVEAILQVGAQPQFVDIDPRTFNMSAFGIERVPRDPLRALRKNRIALCIESRAAGYPRFFPFTCMARSVTWMPSDALQISTACSFLKTPVRRMVPNTFRHVTGPGNALVPSVKAGAFSFYPTKNLGACGEAGAVTTNDEELAEKLRMIRNHGQGAKYHHLIEGYNGRMDAFQAGMLQIKLRHLEDWNAKRRSVAATYNRLLEDADWITTPYEPTWSRAVYHLYVVQVSRRDELQAFLGKRKIETALHYPIPLHLQPAYVQLGFRKGDLPVTEAVTAEILSLPMFPGLKPEQQEQVNEALQQFAPAQALR